MDRAVRELGIDPARSFTVGDRWVDIGLARTIGARGILVRTGYGADEEHRRPPGWRADAVVDNLAGAASWILVNSRQAGARASAIHVTSHVRRHLDACAIGASRCLAKRNASRDSCR